MDKQSETNPYVAPAAGVNAPKLKAEVSYAHRYSRTGKVAGYFVGAFMIVFGIWLGLRESLTDPNIQATPFGIFFFLLVALIGFFLISVIAGRILQGVGFLIGMAGDVTFRRTDSIKTK